MTPDAATDMLHALPRFAGVDDEAYAPGLERIEALLDAMDAPHRHLRTVHVAGTNGKGSVASMIAAIATAAGLRTGLHTSPHIQHLTERMRVDGAPASGDWLAQAVTRHREAFERIGPSFFEATVALSFRYFADRAVRLAVVEVGLGGRLDATNILQPDLALITTIDLDHTNLLGDTVEAIAREKAGIIKPQTPVLIGPLPDAAEAAVRTTAAERHAPLAALADTVTWRAPHHDLTGSVLDVETPVRGYDRLHLPLVGRHQQANAALAVRAAEAVVPRVVFEADPVYEGLGEVRRYAGLRGRLDVWTTDPLVLADVAHNPSSFRATLETVVPHVHGDLTVGLALSREKDLSAIAALLGTYATAVVPLRVNVGRLRSADELADALEAHEVAVRTPATVEDAVRDFHRGAALGDALLLAGSHAVIAERPPNV
jgi:dihydrofolate synthase/folylpolyglutamate synthase